MSHINVLVAASSPDIQEEAIRRAIGRRNDMKLVEDRQVSFAEIGSLLDTVPTADLCALVLVGPPVATEAAVAPWLAERPSLVVLRVDVPAAGGSASDSRVSDLTAGKLTPKLSVRIADVRGRQLLTQTGHPTANIGRRNAVIGGCSRNCGIRAASLCMNSIDDITKSVVPSRHSVLSLSSTCPAALHCTRPSDRAGRVM